MLRTVKKIRNRFLASQKRRTLTYKLRRLLGFTPVNIHIFKLAFKHSSQSDYSHTNNERLEFLGDAVLDSVVSEFLFKKYPLKGEGFLTEMRSKIVNRKQLGDIGQKMDLQDLLDFDKSYVVVNSTILGNTLEALIGAIYMDAGYQLSRKFIYKCLLEPYIDLDKLQLVDINYKSRLFEWSQKYEKELTFEVLEEKMNSNVRIFVVGAYVDGEKLGQGQGRNKKDAQKNAAKEVFNLLKVGEDLGLLGEKR